MTQEQTSKGLHQKYVVRKTDGAPLDVGARYFVLRYDADPAACAAMLAYADAIEATNPELANDLRAEIRLYAGVVELQPYPILTEVERLRAMLSELEWLPSDGMDPVRFPNLKYCPICRMPNHYGHANRCRLAAALSTQ